MIQLTGMARTGLIALWAAACVATEPAPQPEARPELAVELNLQVKGELFATASQAEPVRQPITLDARFEFVERAAATGDGDTVARRYATALADIETDGHRVQQRLADPRVA